MPSPTSSSPSPRRRRCDFRSRDSWWTSSDSPTTTTPICIGTDPFHTPESLGRQVADGFDEQGHDSLFNRPYAGAIVPLQYYQQDERVQSVMIEINRRLYMNESTGAKSTTFDSTRAKVQTVLRSLIEGDSP